jgi:hypothetical protein
LLLVVFLFFAQVAIGFVQTSSEWDVTRTPGINTVPALPLDPMEVYSRSKRQDITVYGRIRLIAIWLLFILGVLGILTVIGINVLILGYVRVG